MELIEFIDENREQIDGFIDKSLGTVPATASCYCPKSGTEHFHQPEARDDEERRLWVLNDEGLYNWARSEGVEI